MHNIAAQRSQIHDVSFKERKLNSYSKATKNLKALYIYAVSKIETLIVAQTVVDRIVKEQQVLVAALPYFGYSFKPHYTNFKHFLNDIIETMWTN